MQHRCAVAMLVFAAFALAPAGRGQTVALTLDPPRLQLKNVKAEAVTFKGRDAVRISDAASADTPDGLRFAIVGGTDFQDGVIEVDLAGDTLPGAAAEFRGFTGLAFRMSHDGSKYESFYLRTKNGRSEDQLQRNHAVQYDAQPDFPWQRLRRETPGKYESYADLVPGAWTHVRIEIHGEKARFYVNGAEQPTLIVNDLKHGRAEGLIALWVGPQTLAHFSNLRINRQ
jgi:hypothetical protein